MLIDTHCHINVMVKKQFDMPLATSDFALAKKIIDEAQKHNVTVIINVGTSIIESQNCITLAHWFQDNYAVVGIHPNDLTDNWKEDIKQLDTWAQQKEQLKVVGIGECGLDFHYPEFNMQQQKDAFKAQIECTLKHDLALVVHTRDARDETLRVLEEYQKEITKGIIHCFSEDLVFAQQVIEWGFAIGLGGTITYPKNDRLREVAKHIDLATIVLETDAPFLPPQSMRGKQNSPASIALIAKYLAELRNEPFEQIANQTTETALKIFDLNHV